MKENVHHEWSLDKNGESRGPFHDTVLAIAWRIWGQPKELTFDRYIKPTPLTCSEASQSNIIYIYCITERTTICSSCIYKAKRIKQS
jgi:hypothetical protein